MLLFEGGLRAIQLTLEEIKLRHTSPTLLYALFIGFVNYMWCYINKWGTGCRYFNKNQRHLSDARNCATEETQSFLIQLVIG